MDLLEGRRFLREDAYAERRVCELAARGESPALVRERLAAEGVDLDPGRVSALFRECGLDPAGQALSLARGRVPAVWPSDAAGSARLEARILRHLLSRGHGEEGGQGGGGVGEAGVRGPPGVGGPGGPEPVFQRLFPPPARPFPQPKRFSAIHRRNRPLGDDQVTKESTAPLAFSPVIRTTISTMCPSNSSTKVSCLKGSIPGPERKSHMFLWYRRYSSSPISAR